MPASPIERLADAVNWLEEELERLRELASEKAGDLMRTADLLMRELENDADILVDSVIRELNELAEKEVEMIKVKADEERARLAEKLRRAAEANKKRAVEEVFKAIIERLGGGGSAG
jgi:membrane protein involved in colicin uptake